MTLRVKNLTIRHRQSQLCLCDNANFVIEPGRVLTLMGPSGCGKSTLLASLAGHLAPDFHLTGSATLAQTELLDLPAHQRQVGILFQQDCLFPHLNVWENLAFALPNHIKGKARRQHALDALATLELNAIAEHFPQQISGGQRARISLLRMLLAQPKLALLDEPFSQLDAKLRTQFRDWVFAELRRANIPTLLVTHDSQDAPSGQTVIHWPLENHHA